jgi:hypothetical protein
MSDTCYHRVMGRLGTALFVLLLAAPPLYAADKVDALSEARQFYNQRQFDQSLEAAERARLIVGMADRADLIAARAYLERFRERDAADDLTNARERLRHLDPQRFDAVERAEFIVGVGEALFFEGSFGAAAGVFETVLDTGSSLAVESRDRVLDWWAIAVDRDAQLRPEFTRENAYQQIRERMHDELATHPGSSTAVYWLAAAARAEGDLQAAWDAAAAGWVRASLTADHGVALRADLDRLMLVAIIPERARSLGQPPEGLRVDWERFKERW